jgi:hypothetical protein
MHGWTDARMDARSKELALVRLCRCVRGEAALDAADWKCVSGACSLLLSSIKTYRTWSIPRS